MPRGGTITLTTRRGDPDGDGAGAWVALAVSDTGDGMDAETQARVFEPFFTTKPGTRGTGLGLATVYGFVTQSGGTTRVASRPGEGTTFTVYLPSVTVTEEISEPVEREGEPEPTARATVLFAEDDGMVRDVIGEVLRRAGFVVMTAVDGREALVKSREHAGVIDVLVTDVVMPGLSGFELADQLTAIRPELRVLYMSGYTDRPVPEQLRPGRAFLHKPARAREVIRTIRRLLSETV